MSTSAIAVPARVGRRCGLCSHPDRALIESELSSGEYSMRAISRRHDLVSESVRRHVRAHVAPDVRAAMQQVAGTPALSIASRVLDIADSARDARLAAEEDGDTKLAAAMGAAEARAMSTLVAMGITTADIAASIHDAEAVLSVFGTLVRDHPEVVEAMVDVLERRNQTAWAEQIRQIAKPFQETNREIAS